MSYRILVADPIAELRDITRFTLELAGHEVVLAETPDEVRSAAELYSFDIVFMDVIMYRGLSQTGEELRQNIWTGVELARELRLTGNTCIATITLLNTVAPRHSKIEELAMAAGVDLVLPKTNLPEAIRTTLKFASMRAAS